MSVSSIFARACRRVVAVFSLSLLSMPAFGEGAVDLQMEVEQPAGSVIADGGAKDFGFSINGSANRLIFALRNTGSTALTGISVVKDGPAAGDFSIVSAPPSALLGGVRTTFTVEFSATSGGLRSARLSIRSSSSGLESYDINLTGQGIVSTNDTDSDGMDDAAEVKLAALGFDWQVAQPELIQTYYANAAATGLYTPSQVADLNVETPLLERKPDGRFMLTLGLQRSTNLTTFTPFPFTSADSSVNAAGEIEFTFPATANAAFFRLKAK